jgi:fructoselysine 3-epimerase
MKLASCTMIYLDYVTLEEAIRRIAKTGFQGVDVWGDSPHLDVLVDRGDHKELGALVRDLGLEWAALSINGGALARPYNFSYSKAWVRAQTLDYYKKCIDVCTEMGIPRLNVISGHMMSDTTYEQAWAWNREGFTAIADYAAPRKVTPCLHTLTPSESRVMVTLDDVLQMHKDIGRPNVRIQIDTADQNITDPNMSESVRKVATLLDYVHFSDNDGVGVGLTHNRPGHGTVSWKRFITELRDNGYKGWLTAQLYSGGPIDPDAWQEECVAYMKAVMSQCDVWEGK